jgi:hypothetical protein
MEVEHALAVAAPREKVFDALTRMGEWWPHRFREAPACTSRRTSAWPADPPTAAAAAFPA